MNFSTRQYANHASGHSCQHVTKKIVDDAFCESDKNKNRCQNNDGKTASQEQFIDQIDSK